ncbi:hypothetical protein WICPIJ_001402 [Wickerhamomyces pijperi]|uniref:Uncharacterized protein n=1 Tax=Wickerhamomyces pijperi TaxID=599730 RepID=A0A9P8QBM1_WICPI|nr:hypothetical protein WICPIJ_001402 [Wickerhamomyces pijperi]
MIDVDTCSKYGKKLFHVGVQDVKNRVTSIIDMISVIELDSLHVIPLLNLFENQGKNFLIVLNIVASTDGKKRSLTVVIFGDPIYEGSKY